MVRVGQFSRYGANYLLKFICTNTQYYVIASLY